MLILFFPITTAKITVIVNNINRNNNPPITEPAIIATCELVPSEIGVGEEDIDEGVDEGVDEDIDEGVDEDVDEVSAI